MRQLYLDGLDNAPEGDLFSEREEAQSREGAQESEVSNPTPKPIERTGIWRNLCPYLEDEVNNKKRPVIVRIDYAKSYRDGVEYVSIVKYTSPGIKEQEAFRSERPDVVRALDRAYENLRDYSRLPVSLLEKGIGFYLIQIGDVSGRKPTSHELFLRDIEAKESTGERMTIPVKKELLRKYFSKYRIGKKLILIDQGVTIEQKELKSFLIKKEKKQREEEELDNYLYMDF